MASLRNPWMNWIIHVTDHAREALSALDAGLREELVREAAELAEDPQNALRRDLLRPDLFTHEYPSIVDPQLRTTLYFDPVDWRRCEMVLVAIAHRRSD